VKKMLLAAAAITALTGAAKSAVPNSLFDAS
jgi:hypothetical protein